MNMAFDFSPAVNKLLTKRSSDEQKQHVQLEGLGAAVIVQLNDVGSDLRLTFAEKKARFEATLAAAKGETPGASAPAPAPAPTPTPATSPAATSSAAAQPQQEGSTPPAAAPAPASSTPENQQSDDSSSDDSSSGSGASATPQHGNKSFLREALNRGREAWRHSDQ